jgi:hypothetical protein
MISAKLPQAQLRHILEQIDGIVAATQGLTFEQVSNNFLYERRLKGPFKLFRKQPKNCPWSCATNIRMSTGSQSLEWAICCGTNITGSSRATCGKS